MVVPLASASGVATTVRLVPEPPSTRFASVTSAWFDELAVTTRPAAALSTSPTVIAIAPVAVSSLVLWSATSEIVGASFTASTVIETVTTFESNRLSVAL